MALLEEGRCPCKRYDGGKKREKRLSFVYGDQIGRNSRFGDDLSKKKDFSSVEKTNWLEFLLSKF